MTLVGFRRATIGVFDETGTQVSEHVIEGKVNKGATSTASVTGLASEAVIVAGSDLTYYVAQQGTGDVAVDMGVIDLENEVNDIILGYRQTESKISMIGKNTKPPCIL